MTLSCPKCEGSMRPRSVDGINIHRCEGCGGVWVQHVDLEFMADTREWADQADTGDANVGRTQNTKQSVACPSCRGARMIHMVDYEQPHVGFEHCQVCGGVYLDAGELRDLAEIKMSERFRGAWKRLRKKS